MGPVTSDSLISNLESRMTAQEKCVADQMAPLPKMIAQIMQVHMQQMVSTLTQQITAVVTQNVKSWIQASPKFFRWAGPMKEVGRPSKISRSIDEDKTEDVPLVTALQASQLLRLPVNVRMFLTSTADRRLSELAELADSVLAVAPSSIAAL
ncbi:hypothetical protein HPB50_007189 [Hyalomma asiaticum]|uniref:Uncharacterized protein n=1 Tax=Hyalomma asiaticum TaxID=266040 RepID=A0ACB7RH88_HYAAI|nr:hypothetical protein HPB50_007189 [Hyalomma asiaticum]